MTREQFLRYYPQFTDFPPRIVLRKALKQANARFESFGDDKEEARRLFIAHKLTMYAYTFPADSASGSGEASPITAASLSDSGAA